MSAERTKLRRLLDTLLGSRWSVWGPVLLAAAVWALFALLGAAEGKAQRLMGAAFAGAGCFFGVWLVLGFQACRTKDAGFAARVAPLLDGITLMALVVTGMAALSGTVRFLADMGSFDPGSVAFPLAVGAIARAHRMRKD